MNRTSFHSRFFPNNRNSLFTQQEYAMQYYGIFTLVVMLGVMVTVANGQASKSLLIWAVLGELAALGLANMMSYAKLHRSHAQIFFLGDHFSLISVYDIIYKKDQHAFPLRFANPSRSQDEISLHYNDQIIVLKRQDWGENFDLIWNWLIADQSQPPQAPMGGGQWESSIS